MVDTALEKKTGAEDVIWDLSVYYDSPKDPRIDEDLAEIQTAVKQCVSDYRGKVGELVAEEIGEAYSRLETIFDDFGRVASFASLNFTVYSTDPEWGAFIQKIQEYS